MIRVAAAFVLVIAVAVAVIALAGDPGRASLVWLGWRADMTAAAAVLIVLGAGLVAMLVWRLLLWILQAPSRTARARAELRRRQAADVLSRGFLAVAAGDGSEARRLAQKAAEVAQESPALVRVLAAEAAEAAGDDPAAEAAYTAMLGFPEMRLAGHRGLMQLAARRGEREAALRHAEQAYSLARTARWAWRALLEARLAEGDWESARTLVSGALDRKIVTPIVADRARAALLAASAAQLEHAPDPRSRDQALDYAVEAAKVQPGFAPGVVMAARLLAQAGKAARAAATVEGAWKIAPHPALFLAYRDLVTDETPAGRAERLARLAGLNPSHRESRILFVERALVAGDAEGARQAALGLEAEPVTARLAGLFARAAFAGGHSDEARMWLARGVSAPQEADWSDLDPEGRAFAYHASDWARLVSTFAETGELIHPRHERHERGLRELPDLPLSYGELLAADAQDQSPYAGAGEGFGEPYDDEDPPPPPPPPTQPRRSPARRRLASAPRAAK